MLWSRSFRKGSEMPICITRGYWNSNCKWFLHNLFFLQWFCLVSNSPHTLCPNFNYVYATNYTKTNLSECLQTLNHVLILRVENWKSGHKNFCFHPGCRDALGSHVYCSLPQQALHQNFWIDETKCHWTLDLVCNLASPSLEGKNAKDKRPSSLKVHP